MSHHTVRTEEVGAVEAPGHGAGLSGLAAGTEGSVQLGVVNPGDSVVREEPGHACRAELAVRVTAGTRDLLWVFLQHKTSSARKFGFCDQLEKLFLEAAGSVCSTFFFGE